MKKINKRGFWMGEESGKFILGVIAVALLLFLMFKIIGIMKENTEYEQAKYTLSRLEETIERLEDGKTAKVLIEGPKNWAIKKIDSPENKFGKVCLCPRPDIPSKWNIFRKDFWNPRNYNEYFLESCKKGLCVTLKKELRIDEKCLANVFECSSIDYIPTEMALTLNGEKYELKKSTTFFSGELYDKILGSSERIEILKNWTFRKNDRGNEDSILEETITQSIKEIEKEKRVEIDKWYLVIGILNNRNEFNYYLWNNGLKLSEHACWKGSFTRRDVVLLESSDEMRQSPSKYCLGGDWFSTYGTLSKDGQIKNILIEIRVDAIKK